MEKIKSIKVKTHVRDVATDIDISTERTIVREIIKKFPDYNIIREEEDNIDNESDYTWAIDPINGTKYFIHGIKQWSTCVGLWYKNKPLLGVVYNPGIKDCYWAEKGKGAFVNNKRLRVSKVNKLSEAIITIDMQKINKLIHTDKVVSIGILLAFQGFYSKVLLRH